MASSLTFDNLLAGARKFADSALDAHAHDDDEVFVLHAGVSIERLAKAALAKTTPFLLMEMKGNDDMLLHFAGLQETPRVRTIGASGAIARLKKMGCLPQRDSELDDLIELRNGVAHFEAGTPNDSDPLATFARVTNQLLDHLQIDHQEYWDNWIDIVRIAINELIEKVERDVSRRIQQARYRLEERFDDLPDGSLLSFASLKERSTHYGVWIDNNSDLVINHRRPCPACDHAGVLVTGRPVMISQNGPGMAEAVQFWCGVCDLALEGAEALKAAGFDIEVPLVKEDGSRLFTPENEIRMHSALPQSALKPTIT
ncbi:hypothetical protein [Streptomyces sp. NPDC058086]|uniref:hypothetical protein n=1 Tax=Streptomyces sp. NPDC058086 TaxID=3346334 RepID=UPI0036E1C2E0